VCWSVAKCCSVVMFFFLSLCVWLHVLCTSVKFCKLCILIVMFTYSYCLYAPFCTFCFHLWRPPIYTTHSYNKTTWASLKPLLTLIQSAVPLTFTKLRAHRKLTRAFMWAVSRPWVIRARKWHIKLSQISLPLSVPSSFINLMRSAHVQPICGFVCRHFHLLG
jgi:hypothetical protein